jgi:transcriptional regulator with XRE-family HTH domain
VRSTIRELRKVKGLSQAEVAERVGTTQVTLSGWENGRHVPNSLHLQKLADVLDVPMGDIAFGAEVREANRARVRRLIAEAASDGSNPGIWSSENGIFVRDRFKPVEALFAGVRSSFVEYCNSAGELIVLPIGTQRRGVRQTPVWRFPAELPA